MSEGYSGTWEPKPFSVYRNAFYIKRQASCSSYNRDSCSTLRPWVLNREKRNITYFIMNIQPICHWVKRWTGVSVQFQHTGRWCPKILFSNVQQWTEAWGDHSQYPTRSSESNGSFRFLSLHGTLIFEADVEQFNVTYLHRHSNEDMSWNWCFWRTELLTTIKGLQQKFNHCPWMFSTKPFVPGVWPGYKATWSPIFIQNWTLIRYQTGMCLWNWYLSNWNMFEAGGR